MSENENRTDVARAALLLDKQIKDLTATLNARKEQLRELAGGEQLTEVVEGLGTVAVSKPRSASSTSVLILDEAKLNAIPDLKQGLLRKGILRQEEKLLTGAAASVTFKHNV